MPQIWLTYEELGNFIERSPDDARNYVAERHWDRRRSRDGYTRVKLPLPVARSYLEKWLAQPDAVAAPGNTFRAPAFQVALGGSFGSPAFRPAFGI